MLTPAQDRFYADPFPIELPIGAFLFFEDLPYVTGRGHISCAPIDARGRPGTPRPVLERPYHLSYPFVFKWRRQVWMLPESIESRALELYRAVDFPDRWELEARLFEGMRVVDPTLFEHEGRFWLFANVVALGCSPDDELCLFYAPSPLGPWTPHPRNPVLSDVRRARPGGPLFRSGGAIQRPSQDCSVRYGYALSVNRVDRLNLREYSETPILHIDPSWQSGATGTHTLARSTTLEAIDWKIEVPIASRP